MVTKKKVSKHVGAYPVEFRLKVVRLHLEEGYEVAELAEEFGCGKSTAGKWVRLYREHGECNNKLILLCRSIGNR